MKIISALVCLLLIGSFTYGQVLKSNGIILDTHNNTIGYMKSDGIVQDSHHNVLGYINKSNRTVEDKNHKKIAYINISNGTLEDLNHKVIDRKTEEEKRTGALFNMVFRQFFFK